MKNYLVLENGDKINIDKINEQFPFSMLESDEVVFRVSELVVEKVYLFSKETLDYKIAVNFLCQRSKKVKNIAAVILLSNQFKISKIDVEYINRLFAVFFEYPIYFKNYQIKKNYLDYSLLFTSFVKYFPNRLFLLAHALFFRKGNNKDSVIRAWVDVDAKLHESIIKDSTIFIYPFGINLFRSIKFIKHCFTYYDSVSLMGVPYSFISLLKIYIILLRKSDRGIVDYEIKAMKMHTNHFSGFKKIFTSDEYIPAIYALYNYLDRKITVINNCHGIGVYNRFVNYTTMLVFNIAQKKYYELNNPHLRYEIKLDDYQDKYTSFKTNDILIYLDQGDLRNFNLMYEYKMQGIIMAKLNDLSQLEGANTYIKFHPNRDSRSKKSLLNKYSHIKQFYSFDDFSNKEITFINLFSTAYYDFRNLGKVLFVKDDLFNPEKIFGKNISTISLEDFGKSLS